MHEEETHNASIKYGRLEPPFINENSHHGKKKNQTYKTSVIIFTIPQMPVILIRFNKYEVAKYIALYKNSDEYQNFSTNQEVSLSRNAISMLYSLLLMQFWRQEKYIDKEAFFLQIVVAIRAEFINI